MTARATPAPGPRYWTALCVASLLGANLGDWVAHELHVGHWRGVPVLLVLLAGAILADCKTRFDARPFFWSAVVLVRTVATNLADLGTHDLHLSQPAMIGGLATGFVSVAIAADRTRAGAGFWTALFLAGTLGTVLGDDVSHRLGLAVASLALGAMTALLFTARSDRYWTRVLAIRTAGTSIADLTASGFGLTASTGMMAALLAAAIRMAPPAKGQSPFGNPLV